MDDPQAFELDHIRRAAFNITSSFEGSKTYANYQNYDAGIISYGRFQYTLSSGALSRVINYYLASSTSSTATQVKAYQARIQARDAELRSDEALMELLLAAATEPAMQAAQDRVVMESYWAPARDSITSRGIVLPLSQALIFDMAVQHGPANKITQNAEAQLGAPPKSMLGVNGLNERQLIAQVSWVRRDFLYEFAEKNNLPGVRRRADFWVELVSSGDWQLEGDVSGNVYVYGRPVQVKLPPGETMRDPTYNAGPPLPPLPATGGSTPPAADIPPTDVGQPISGRFVAGEVLPVYYGPTTTSGLKERVMQGESFSVIRQYMPSVNEEWLLTEVGWIARRLESVPGAVFGTLTIS